MQPTAHPPHASGTRGTHEPHRSHSPDGTSSRHPFPRVVTEHGDDVEPPRLPARSPPREPGSRSSAFSDDHSSTGGTLCRAASQFWAPPEDATSPAAGDLVRSMAFPVRRAQSDMPAGADPLHAEIVSPLTIVALLGTENDVCRMFFVVVLIVWHALWFSQRLFTAIELNPCSPRCCVAVQSPGGPQSLPAPVAPICFSLPVGYGSGVCVGRGASRCGHVTAHRCVLRACSMSQH